MDLKQIKELISIMEKGSLTEIEIKNKDFGLKLIKQEKISSPPAQVPPIPHPPFHPSLHPPFPPHEGYSYRKPQEENQPQNLEKRQESGKYISSPMVGTLYAATSPEDSPFVKVGDRVEEGTVVCIVEAMKVMNEVKAGCSGTIAEILVENGSPVEFGTKIFRVV